MSSCLLLGVFKCFCVRHIGRTSLIALVFIFVFLGRVFQLEAPQDLSLVQQLPSWYKCKKVRPDSVYPPRFHAIVSDLHTHHQNLNSPVVLCRPHGV